MLCVPRGGGFSALIKPIDGIFGVNEQEKSLIKDAIDEAYERCLHCFKAIKDPYYSTNGVCPYHSGQYLTFLYYLGNTIYKRYENDTNQFMEDLCEKIFMTSLTISSADIYYKHEMPDIFFAGHPLGTVISGKAKIGNYFLFMQSCNLGINNDKAPVLGEGVVMWQGSKIVGNCRIGSHVMFAANSYVKDMDVPDNSIVYGQYPNNVIKENQQEKVMKVLKERFFI